MTYVDALLLGLFLRFVFIAYEEWTSIYIQIRTENERERDHG